MRVLVVEDERDMNRLIMKTLTKAGYSVDGCFDGEEAQYYLDGAEYDVLLLDVMMPKLDGFSLLSHLRSQGVETPVLLLTARDSIDDRVKGLDLGADDYLIKPFSFEELLARIRVLTRKQAGRHSNLLTIGDLQLDIKSHRVTRNGEEIQLLPKEFAILEYMMHNQNTVLSRQQIEDRIWNYEYSGSSNNVDVYMSKLRKKVDGSRPDKLIHTIRGSGWVLRQKSAEEKK